MRQKTLGRSIGTVAILLFYFLTYPAAAQFPRSFIFDVSRMPQRDGSVHFEMNVSSGVRQVVHLPDGTSLTSGFDPNNRFADRTYTSFDELKNAIVGTWTIEHLAFPPFDIPHEEYTFTLSDFPESAIYEAPPSITYPLHGSVVPREFTMTWEWPAGETPSMGRTTLVRRFHDAGYSQSGTGGYPRNELSTPISAIDGGGSEADRMTLWAGGYLPNALAGYLSEVAPQQSMPEYRYTLRFASRSMSVPVNVFVGVPECNGILLFAMGMSACLFPRRAR
jgi:hypothetical protein